jgi:hypothetical protein
VGEDAEPAEEAVPPWPPDTATGEAPLVGPVDPPVPEKATVPEALAPEAPEDPVAPGTAAVPAVPGAVGVAGDPGVPGVAPVTPPVGRVTPPSDDSWSRVAAMVCCSFAMAALSAAIWLETWAAAAADASGVGVVPTAQARVTPVTPAVAAAATYDEAFAR